MPKASRKHDTWHGAVLGVLFAALFAGVVHSADTEKPGLFGGIYAGELPEYSRLDPVTFTLPRHLGEVKFSSPSGSGGKFIIHIQDAHCNPYAQMRIAEIIDHVKREYGVEMVNLEGGSGEYDLAAFTSISGEEIRKEVAKYFVRKGDLGGAEYYAIVNPGRVSLWGVEDKPLYMANLKVYRDAVVKKADTSKSIVTLEKMLEAVKKVIYSPETFKLDKNFWDYSAGTTDFTEYARNIRELADQASVGYSDLPAANALFTAMDLDKKIKFREAEKQKKALMEELKNTLSPYDMRGCITKAMDFKLKKISSADFCEYLLGKATEMNIAPGKYPDFKKYAEYLRVYETINRAAISGELGSLEDKILAKTAKSPAEQALWNLSRNLLIMKDIFNVQLTKSEYLYYLANRNAFAVTGFVEFCKKGSSRTVEELLPADGLISLDKERDFFMQFYEYSFERDKAFVRNLKFTPLKTEETGVSKAAIIVTGGFHTENLCDLLNKEGIGFVSILPSFTTPANWESPYISLLAGETKGVDQTFMSALAKAQMLAIASKLNSLGADALGSDTVDVMFLTLLINVDLASDKNARAYRLTDGAGEPLIADGAEIIVTSLTKKDASAETVDKKLSDFVQKLAAEKQRLTAPEFTIPVELSGVRALSGTRIPVRFISGEELRLDVTVSAGAPAFTPGGARLAFYSEGEQVSYVEFAVDGTMVIVQTLYVAPSLKGAAIAEQDRRDTAQKTISGLLEKVPAGYSISTAMSDADSLRSVWSRLKRLSGSAFPDTRETVFGKIFSGWAVTGMVFTRNTMTAPEVLTPDQIRKEYADFDRFAKEVSVKVELARSEAGTERPGTGLSQDEVRVLSRTGSADLDPAYAAAVELVPYITDMMSKNVPTYVVEPVLRVEEESPVLDLLKQTQKRMGAGIRASTYDAGAKWLDEEALKNKPAVYTLAPGRKKELDNDLDAFLTDLGTNPNTRMVIRVALAEEDDGAVRSIKAAIRAFVEEKIGKGRVLAVNFAMEKIKVVAAVYEKPEYSNPAMDLFLDASMAELDRYGKLDGYPGKEIPDNFRLKFMELLKVSAANFDEEFRGITSIEALLNKIFSGTFLKIRKIDWESIKQWKLQNEAVLRSV